MQHYCVLRTTIFVSTNVFHLCAFLVSGRTAGLKGVSGLFGLISTNSAFKLWTDNTPWIDDVLQNKTKTCITVRVHHMVLYWVGCKGTEPYIFFPFVTGVLILILNQCGTILVVNCFAACISCESCQEEEIFHSLLWGVLWPKYKKETGKGRNTSQEQIDRMLTAKEAAQLFFFSFPIFVHFVLEWGLGWKRREVNLGEAKCLILIFLFFSWDLL